MKDIDVLLLDVVWAVGAIEIPKLKAFLNDALSNQ